MELDNETIEDFDFPVGKPSIIKVIGVGGGGGNAVNHMYREGIHDVSFAVCNTDNQALSDSPVPIRLQLGKEGLGAGNRPARAREAAEESVEEIRKMLSDGTRMVFITAGMGGGTGTGAAPVIAREAKAMDILTVGIVTIPFMFEGRVKIDQALDGVDEISKHVDALLVINNERLREIYTDLTMLDAFARADDTLSIAAKSISEVITVRGRINLDFNDVRTVLKDGGVAIMSTGYGEGDKRVTKAIQEALNSPLLNNNDIFNSKKVLLNITFCAASDGETLMMDEMNEVHEFMSRFATGVETKWGLAVDPTLGKRVKITVLTTGFGLKSQSFMESRNEQEANEASAAEEEDTEKKDRRAQEFYGTDRNNIAPIKRRLQFYCFGEDDLDNEEVILLVEDTPTYKRSKEQYNQIKKATNKFSPASLSTDADAPNVISFSL
ncbi:MAG: cell division protein FtsZ [Bacteroidaceae bacterium]